MTVHAYALSQGRGSTSLIVELPVAVPTAGWQYQGSTPGDLGDGQSVTMTSGQHLPTTGSVEVVLNDLDNTTDAYVSHQVHLDDMYAKATEGAATDSARSTAWQGYTIRLQFDKLNGHAIEAGKQYALTINVEGLTGTYMDDAVTPAQQTTAPSSWMKMAPAYTALGFPQKLTYQARYNSSNRNEIILAVSGYTSAVKGYATSPTILAHITVGGQNKPVPIASLADGDVTVDVTSLGLGSGSNELNISLRNAIGTGPNSRQVIGYGETLPAPTISRIDFDGQYAQKDLVAGEAVASFTLNDKAESWVAEICNAVVSTNATDAGRDQIEGSGDYYKAGARVGAQVSGDSSASVALFKGLQNASKYILRVRARRAALADEGTSPNLDGNGNVQSNWTSAAFVYTNLHQAATNMSLLSLPVVDAGSSTQAAKLRFVLPEADKATTLTASNIALGQGVLYLRPNGATKFADMECAAVLDDKTSDGDIITGSTGLSWVNSTDAAPIVGGGHLKVPFTLPAALAYNELAYEVEANMAGLDGFDMMAHLEIMSGDGTRLAYTGASLDATSATSAASNVALSKSNGVELKPRVKPAAPTIAGVSMVDATTQESLAEYKNGRWEAKFEISVTEGPRPANGSLAKYEIHAVEYVPYYSAGSIAGYNKGGDTLIGSIDNSKDDAASHNQATPAADTLGGPLKGMFPNNGQVLTVGRPYAFYAVAIVDGEKSSDGTAKPAALVDTFSGASTTTYAYVEAGKFAAPLEVTLARTNTSELTVTFKDNAVNASAGAAVDEYYLEFGRFNASGAFNAIGSANAKFSADKSFTGAYTSLAWDGSKYVYATDGTVYTAISGGMSAGQTLSVRVFAKNGAVAWAATDAKKATPGVASYHWSSADGPAIQGAQFLQDETGLVRVSMKNGGAGLTKVIALAVPANEQDPSPRVYEVDASKLSERAKQNDDSAYFLEIRFQDENGMDYKKALSQIYIVVANANGIDNKALSA